MPKQKLGFNFPFRGERANSGPAQSTAAYHRPYVYGASDPATRPVVDDERYFPTPEPGEPNDPPSTNLPATVLPPTDADEVDRSMLLIARRGGKSSSRRQRRFPTTVEGQLAVPRWAAAGFDSFWVEFGSSGLVHCDLGPDGTLVPRDTR
ncbi:hypothetical protein [Streptacidiphilus sp. EB103A]|uniref:hypothetical protein n=1 Tax=Streptacidiphilus sp. EB103A TaxID=3156275 RepID=UPI0035152144